MTAPEGGDNREGEEETEAESSGRGRWLLPGAADAGRASEPGAAGADHVVGDEAERVWISPAGADSGAGGDERGEGDEAWGRPIQGAWGTRSGPATAMRVETPPWRLERPVPTPPRAPTDPFRPPAGAPDAAGARGVGSLELGDVAAAVALILDVGVALLLLGGFLAGISGDTFLGTTLVSQFDRSFRFRLLAVFGEASLVTAAMLVLAVAVATARPAVPRPRLRRPALAAAAGLGVYVAMGALLRAIVLLTLVRTTAALSIGSALGALAAVPVALGVTVWAALLVARDDPDADRAVAD